MSITDVYICGAQRFEHAESEGTIAQYLTRFEKCFFSTAVEGSKHTRVTSFAVAAARSLAILPSRFWYRDAARTRARNYA